MKITFSVLFLMVAASAFGQVAGAISNQAQMLQIADHTLHAEPHALATERSLIGGDSPAAAIPHPARRRRPRLPQGKRETSPQKSRDYFRKTRLVISSALNPARQAGTGQCQTIADDASAPHETRAIHKTILPSIASDH
jgi:hypothetical protein